VATGRRSSSGGKEENFLFLVVVGSIVSSVVGVLFKRKGEAPLNLSVCHDRRRGTLKKRGNVGGLGKNGVIKVIDE